MRAILLVAALVVVASASFADISEKFIAFKAKYNKKYPTLAEEQKRFGYFVANLKKAAAIQATNPHATFGVNIFSDVSESEFKSRHNLQGFLKARSEQARKELAPLSIATPTKIDWREKGAVTGVKDQGQCGSCWSFSTTGNIEGQWFLAGNPLVSLSEQELVSCDTIDDGCNGGFQDNAFEWLFFATQGVITTEAAYPYASGAGTVAPCQKEGKPFGARITAYADVARDENVMAAQCAAKGPVAVSLDATSFQTYISGILTDCISQEIDHAVLVVGFDDTNSPPYWIVKNSWSASWGENGYIRILKGSNQCLIKNMPTTAIVGAGPNPTPAPTNPTPAPTNPTPAPTNPTPAPTNPTPAPTNPTPAPTNPTPAPSNNATYTQITCEDAACSVGCTSQTLPQNTCIQTPDGDSATAQCTTDGLLVTLYPFSGDCSGFSFQKLEALNTCQMDSDGSFLENVCPSSAAHHLTSMKMRLTKAIKSKLGALKKL